MSESVSSTYPEPPSKKRNDIAIELISGSVGGAAQVLSGQPLDTLKTRAQTAPRGQFKNTLDILQQTVRNEGFFALYKVLVSPGDTTGLSQSTRALVPWFPRTPMSPLLGIAAVNSLLFTAYGASRRIVSPFPDLTVPQVALAGSMAGAANAVLASPTDSSSDPLQIDSTSVQLLFRPTPPQSSSSSDRLRCSPASLHTVEARWTASERIGAGWNGLERVLFPVSAVLAVQNPNQRFGSPLDPTIIIRTSRDLLWLPVLIRQVEMFKIRMQGQYGGAGDKRLRQVVGDMWREYGVRNGIMRGYWITVIREIPAYAGFYTGYELTKRYFSKHFTPDPVPIWALLCSGAVGGVSYWLACYPLDVVKSRIQLAKEPPTRGVGSAADTSRGSWQRLSTREESALCSEASDQVSSELSQRPRRRLQRSK
ncbi:hypothetical protein EHS25_000554 [Saitozyma podzolica]|uniref:Carnitine transporter n=1 Tax=Saitozyma podzolica TaxID=1890683 RepID=A0A427YWI8_9TREE|nr:hypothetical protein EHS25_000554 [Saitozyma podzolica]